MTQEKLASPADQPAVDRAATWTRRHLLDVDDFTTAELDTVMDTTDAMKEVMGRDVPRVPALRGKTIVTLFYEASTRTRASFELAGKALGADVINISAGGSSIEKGESLIDTVRTLQAVGADLLVMRHSASGAPYLVARHLKAAVINAGDGWHAHPTQALLDLYTIRAHLGEVRGRRIVIVGDIAHSRVARSNIWALSTMGAEVIVCAPPTLLPAGLRPSSADHGPGPEGDATEPLAMPPVHVDANLDRAVEGADVVMTLRLQKERMQGGLLPSVREYATLYQLNEERMSRARTGALVMHPGPMNEGIEISPALVSSLQSVIEEQVTNGVAVRMAVLYLLARGGK
ncbi:MAG TPA: aspartate carbamoyltransferase catalytic subunit [Dehalococcoidia bacterium]|nr:aspartate carbamoyltransferase catalytic subunit [Dehalococcoidia bacterium]